ncbi:hypothetical protein L873DRAFT_1817388, partial [Choiromyces venosus 120613-1]
MHTAFWKVYLYLLTLTHSPLFQFNCYTSTSAFLFPLWCGLLVQGWCFYTSARAGWRGI